MQYVKPVRNCNFWSQQNGPKDRFSKFPVTSQHAIFIHPKKVAIERWYQTNVVYFNVIVVGYETRYTRCHSHRLLWALLGQNSWRLLAYIYDAFTKFATLTALLWICQAHDYLCTFYPHLWWQLSYPYEHWLSVRPNQISDALLWIEKMYA